MCVLQQPRNVLLRPVEAQLMLVKVLVYFQGLHAALTRNHQYLYWYQHVTGSAQCMGMLKKQKGRLS